MSGPVPAVRTSSDSGSLFSRLNPFALKSPTSTTSSSPATLSVNPSLNPTLTVSAQSPVSGGLNADHSPTGVVGIAAGPVIAIDIGGSNIRAAQLNDSRNAELFLIDSSNTYAPAVVYMQTPKSTRTLVGSKAVEAAALTPTKAVILLPRILTDIPTDPRVIDDAALLPYSIVREGNNDNAVAFQTATALHEDDDNGINNSHSCTRLYSVVFAAVKRAVEYDIRTVRKESVTVSQVVAVIDNNLTTRQRLQLIEAASEAHLNIRTFITAPLAAAIYAKYSKRLDPHDRYIVSIDIGTTSINASVIQVDPDHTSTGGLHVITSTRKRLGGVDFTHALMRYCQSEFTEQFIITTFASNAGASSNNTHTNTTTTSNTASNNNTRSENNNNINGNNNNNIKGNNNNDTDISSDAIALWRLRNECDRVKKKLSSTSMAVIQLNTLHNGHDFSTTITRTQFEEICDYLFNQLKKVLERLFIHNNIHSSSSSSTNNVKVTDISHVILSGRAALMPKCSRIIRQFFNIKNNNNNNNNTSSVTTNITTTSPDDDLLGLIAASSPSPSVKLTTMADEDAAVSGAAYVTSFVEHQDDDEFITRQSPSHTQRIFTECLPFDIGVELSDGSMALICTRSSSLPCAAAIVLRCRSSTDTSVTINVFEGLRKRARKNAFLLRTKLLLLPEIMKDGYMRIKVSVAVDATFAVRLAVRQIMAQTDIDAPLPPSIQLSLPAQLYAAEDEADIDTGDTPFDDEFRPQRDI